MLQSALQQHPGDMQIENRVISAYLSFGEFSNALQIVSTRLARMPADVGCLRLEAEILIQSGNSSAAIPVLTHILTLTNLPEARLNRASACLAGQDYAAAESDYRELEKSGKELGLVNYGLAMIAEHRQDTNQAAYYLRICLTNASPETILWKKANGRLEAIQPGRKASFSK
jgi:tetratricopeptide (TPR) repeat protein